MDKKRTRYVLSSILLIIIIECIICLVRPDRWIMVAIILAINGALFFAIVWLTRRIEWSNLEKIRETNRLAEEGTRNVLKTMPVGIIMYEPDTYEITWLNPYSDAVFYQKQQLTLSSETVKAYVEAVNDGGKFFRIGDKTFQYIVHTEEHLIYFFDVTEENQLSKEQLDQQPAIGIVSIDNYDDVTDGMDEKKISYLNSLITTIVSDWMEEYQVFYKRINEERYFFVAQYQDIKRMIDHKFDLLDKLREESINQGVPITLSMGISYGQSNVGRIGEAAQTNLDIALVRGGDQAVIREDRENAKPLYFGGRSISVARRTRVRSRAMSTALKGILQQTDEVYVMGHRYPDMDAIGAAFGVAKLAELNDRPSYVILNNNEIIPDVERCIQEVKKYPELESKIISPEGAIEQRAANSLLVMVDYHKPSLSISKELYDQFDRIVVIDHHRRGAEFPSKPLLTYIESGASSASELVTELLEYQGTRTKHINSFEASLLLAGIVVDTKSFTIRTTARTFDVASYLRTRGADSELVQYLLSTDLASYQEMNHLIDRSEYVTEDILVTCADEKKEYDSVTAAKTADTLLSMSGINAAFVITKRTDGLIGISARSSGAINVQVIMEELGGGGHFTNAAAQFQDQSLAEVKEQLLNAIHDNINEMYEKE